MNELCIFSLDWKQWGFYEWMEFSVNYLVPLIGCIALIAGGFWAVYQYFNEKNRQFYLEVLNNVYAPLFEVLIQNEYERKLKKEKTTNRKARKLYAVKAVPFFYLQDAKSPNNMNTNAFEQELRALCEDEHENRIQYAPRDLLALLKAYYILEEENFKNVEVCKKKVQCKIRKNVIIGYKRYRRKLGLKDISIWRFCYSIGGWLIFRM